MSSHATFAGSLLCKYLASKVFLSKSIGDSAISFVTLMTLKESVEQGLDFFKEHSHPSMPSFCKASLVAYTLTALGGVSCLAYNAMQCLEEGDVIVSNLGDTEEETTSRYMAVGQILYHLATSQLAVSLLKKSLSYGRYTWRILYPAKEVSPV
jgi:hypothetical protein